MNDSDTILEPVLNDEQDEQVEQIEQIEQAESEENLPQKPVIIVYCASDSLRAEIELQRQATQTLNPTREDIEAVLAENGIVYGIDQKFVDHLCSQPFYNVKADIAKGKMAKIGADGYLKYLIETEKDMKPKIRKDGTADYFDLGFVQNVLKGQALCEVHNPEKGEDGMNIYGMVLEGMYGREPDVPIGLNTELQKETGMVVAVVDGNVEVDRKGIINVFDILRISGNVDNSTGNINFVGDVIINGDVLSGFQVDSQGCIAVKGTVEAAHLNAKGDISVGESINGMNRARIYAGGNVKSKYIQNCHMETGGDIFADSIMHSTVECNGSIELSGKRGAIIGGKTVVGKTLIVKQLGTESHVATHITVSIGGLALNKKILDIKKAINALDTELLMLKQTIAWCEDIIIKKKEIKPFQVNAYKNSRARMLTIDDDINVKKDELKAVQEELDNIEPGSCFIKASGRVHTGVRITFGIHTMKVLASFAHSRILLIDGEITVSPI